MAALAVGEPIVETARRFGLSKQTVSRWAQDGTVGTDNARVHEAVAGLIVTLVSETTVAICAQLRACSRDDWLAQQPAADIASLVGAEYAGLLRILAGFRPVGAADVSALNDSNTGRGALDTSA